MGCPETDREDRAYPCEKIEGTADVGATAASAEAPLALGWVQRMHPRGDSLDAHGVLDRGGNVKGILRGTGGRLRGNDVIVPAMSLGSR